MIRRRREPARGFARRDTRRIAVTFDDETFDHVRRLAKRAGVSFAEQNRQLVEWGLEAVIKGEADAGRTATRRDLRLRSDRAAAADT